MDVDCEIQREGRRDRCWRRSEHGERLLRVHQRSDHTHLRMPSARTDLDLLLEPLAVG